MSDRKRQRSSGGGGPGPSGGRGRGRGAVLPAWMSQGSQQAPPATFPPNPAPPAPPSGGYSAWGGSSGGYSSYSRQNGQPYGGGGGSVPPPQSSSYGYGSYGGFSGPPPQTSALPVPAPAPIPPPSMPKSLEKTPVEKDFLGKRVGRWTVQLDEESHSIFYYDPVSKQSRWERPREPPRPPPRHELPPLPSDDWVEVLDEGTGRHFYWNERSDETVWTLDRAR